MQKKQKQKLHTVNLSFSISIKHLFAISATYIWDWLWIPKWIFQDNRQLYDLRDLWCNYKEASIKIAEISPDIDV